MKADPDQVVCPTPSSFSKGQGCLALTYVILSDAKPALRQAAVRRERRRRYAEGNLQSA
jgi:hypothetical protein